MKQIHLNPSLGWRGPVGVTGFFGRAFLVADLVRAPAGAWALASASCFDLAAAAFGWGACLAVDFFAGAAVFFAALLAVVLVAVFLAPVFVAAFLREGLARPLVAAFLAEGLAADFFFRAAAFFFAGLAVGFFADLFGALALAPALFLPADFFVVFLLGLIGLSPSPPPGRSDVP
ncbi:MAG: hypothetical protein V3T64_10375, partial [Myxococcota bacterium]